MLLPTSVFVDFTHFHQIFPYDGLGLWRVYSFRETGRTGGPRGNLRLPEGILQGVEHRGLRRTEAALACECAVDQGLLVCSRPITQIRDTSSRREIAIYPLDITVTFGSEGNCWGYGTVVKGRRGAGNRPRTGAACYWE